MKNRQSRVKKGLMGLIGGTILALGTAGLVGGCNSSNSSQKPTKKDYNETSIVESEYEKLEKDILKKVRRTATIDPNDLEPGFFGEYIGEKGYSVHYHDYDKDGEEFHMVLKRPERHPENIIFGILYLEKELYSSKGFGFGGHIKETDKKNKVKIRIGNDYKFIQFKKKADGSLTKISKTYVNKPEGKEGLLISTDISIKEMQDLVSLIKEFEAKYAPKDFKP